MSQGTPDEVEQAPSRCNLAHATLRSFWRHVSNLERRETRRYLQMFYCLMMRPLIAKVGTLQEDAVGSHKMAWQPLLHQMFAMWARRWQLRRETWKL